MNGNTILRFGVMILGLFAAVVVIFQVLTDYRNNLSSLFKLLSVAGFLIGFFQPRLSVYLLVLVCAYLDLLKRCLLLYGQVYFSDVVTVLSLAPLMFAGICCGLMMDRFRRPGRMFNSAESRIFWITIFIGIAMIAVNVRTYGSLGTGLVNGANSGAYIPFILFAGFLFPTLASQRAFLRFILIAFIPVALYTFKQAFFGFSDLERLYLVSGLTVMEGQIDAELIRPFSTLNSAHALGIVSVILFTLGIYKSMTSKRGRLFYVGVTLLYLAAVIPGFMRTAWAMAAATSFAIVFFRSRVTTLATYGASIALFLVVVGFSGYLNDNISEFSMGADSNSIWIARAGTMGTMTDRLSGFHNWSRNPEMWSLFGLDQEKVSGDDHFGTHDPIGGILITYGVVGLVMILTLLGLGLYFAHSRVLRIGNREDRFLGICYLSILFGILLSGAASGSHLSIFPINFFAWFIAGALVALVKRSNEQEAAAQSESGEEAVPFGAARRAGFKRPGRPPHAGAHQPAIPFGRTGRGSQPRHPFGESSSQHS